MEKWCHISATSLYHTWNLNPRIVFIFLGCKFLLSTNKIAQFWRFLWSWTQFKPTLIRFKFKKRWKCSMYRGKLSLSAAPPSTFDRRSPSPPFLFFATSLAPLRFVSSNNNNHPRSPTTVLPPNSSPRLGALHPAAPCKIPAANSSNLQLLFWSGCRR